jgi:hypothetical protein
MKKGSFGISSETPLSFYLRDYPLPEGFRDFPFGGLVKGALQRMYELRSFCLRVSPIYKGFHLRRPARHKYPVSGISPVTRLNADIRMRTIRGEAFGCQEKNRSGSNPFTGISHCQVGEKNDTWMK